jgi:heptosyltransferase-2
VRAPNWIGDQILAYPFFHYLRQIYPSAKIVVACVPWVQAVQFRNLVDEVYHLPVPMTHTFLAKWDVLEKGARALKAAGPWDLGISLPNSFYSAYFLFRAGAKVRRGYNMDGRGILLTQPVHWEKKNIRHRADAYVRLLPEDQIPQRPVTQFWGVPPPDDLDPAIPGVLDHFDAEKAWPQSEAVEPPVGPYWVLAPGSTAETRRWPMDRFLSFAREVAKDTGWTGVIIGGPGESEVAAKMVDEPGIKLLDWTARGTVASYWKVFRNARFSLCNDSGLAHVASLCGSPVQIVWGGGNPNRTEPIGPGKVQVSFNPVDCWPCEQNLCSQPPGKKLDCLKGISPNAVWNEIKTGFRPQ